jgi:hypothetical protein
MFRRFHASLPAVSYRAEKDAMRALFRRFKTIIAKTTERLSDADARRQSPPVLDRADTNRLLRGREGRWRLRR